MKPKRSAGGFNFCLFFKIMFFTPCLKIISNQTTQQNNDTVNLSESAAARDTLQLIRDDKYV